MALNVSKELATNAVNELLEVGKTIRGVATKYRLACSTLASWAAKSSNFAKIHRLENRVMELEKELEFVKSSAPLLGLPNKQKYAYIESQAKHYPVVFMCRCLDVSRSGYYNWCSRGLSERERRNRELMLKIMKIYEISRGLYGSPRIHGELIADRIKVSRKRVANLMKRMGLRADRPKKFVVTTLSDHDGRIAPDLLQRNFTVSAPNQVWVSDLTYVWTEPGWVYLAVIIDLYARKVVGWAAADHMRDELVLSALDDAIGKRNGHAGLSGLIFHSDRGSQYASDDFIAALEGRGISRSMSRRGDCWDNAVAESFFATLKKELIYREEYVTRESAIDSIEDYIELFYNPTRRHSTNGYISPNSLENLA